MKIKPQYGFEVGISVGGHIRLAQCRDETYGEQVILLSPREVQLLAAELRLLMKLKDHWWCDAEQEGDE